jgi:hypothetical protein
MTDRDRLARRVAQSVNRCIVCGRESSAIGVLRIEDEDAGTTSTSLYGLYPHHAGIRKDAPFFFTRSRNSR